MTNLEARLQRLEDRDAIHQLFIDYGRFLDAGDLDAYAALFAEDGEVMLGPIGSATGRDNIRALMGKILSGRAGSAYHIISSPTVALNGDEATSEVMWTVIQRDAEGKPRLASMGRHVDRLVRLNGEWKIAQRRGVIDLPQQLPQPGDKPAPE
jgi:uncharacterized protein (TIGR02246 family)